MHRRIAGISIWVAGLAAPVLVHAQASPQAGGLILNEYNAVNSTTTLFTDPTKPWKGHDSFFNPEVVGNPSANPGILGNGGNWVELVVTQDHLNIQGWQLVWHNKDVGTGDGSVVFTNSSTWSNLRAGTIITVREDDTGTPGGYGAMPTDLSFKPDHNDWWMHINVDDTRYVTQTGFKVDNDDWQATIKDAKGRVEFGPVGESVAGWGGGGINSQEAGVNRSDPSSSIAGSDFEDNDYTTFGSPNTHDHVTDSVYGTQDFSALRTWYTRADRITGDANLDRVVDVDDLYILATNWLTTGNTWMDADFNGDGVVDGKDLGLLGVNWQTAVAGEPLDLAISQMTFVPEPASLAMLLLPAFVLRRKARRA